MNEYPKALYLAGLQLVVANLAEEDDAREAGYDDWHADAARAERPSAPEASTVDVDVLRETEARLLEAEQQLRDRDEQLTARENELIAREETVIAAEAELAAKQAAALNEAPPADTGTADALDREALKARATELGIDFPRNVTTEKLAELIAAHKV